MIPNRKARVVYWNNIPSPYAVERFNLIADNNNFDFEVWFNEVREPDRSWDVIESEWRFPARYIPERSLLGWRAHLPIPELFVTRPDVLVCLYYEPVFAFGSLAARVLASRLTYHVLPTYDAWSRRTWWREVAKHILFRSIDSAEISGPDAANLTRKYGLPNSRSLVVTQSINVSHYRRAKDFTPENRTQGRSLHGLQGCVFLYVGRLWWGKGLDYLFEAYKVVLSKYPDVSLLIVGDGVDEIRYRAMFENLPRVVFKGFIQAKDMPAFYALADVLVFPTLGDPFGYVVEEAMAAGLPVISSENAGEIRDRISDGETGYIVPSANSQILAERMLILAQSPALRNTMASLASSQVTSISHERYAFEFESLVEHTTSLQARRTPISFLARVFGMCIATVGKFQNWVAAPYVDRKGS